GNGDFVLAVSWSPDASSNTVASISLDGSLRLWDVDSETQLNAFSGHTDFIYRVRWSPDYSRIATAGVDGSVKIWDAATIELLFNFQEPYEFAYGVAWSPDCLRPRLAGSFVDETMGGTIRIWNPQTGELLRLLRGGHDARVNDLMWSLEGRRLVSGADDRKVVIWDADSGEVLQRLEGHTNAVEGVAWWADAEGEKVISGSRDNTI